MSQEDHDMFAINDKAISFSLDISLTDVIQDIQKTGII